MPLLHLDTFPVIAVEFAVNTAGELEKRCVRLTWNTKKEKLKKKKS